MAGVAIAGVAILNPDIICIAVCEIKKCAKSERERKKSGLVYIRPVENGLSWGSPLYILFLFGGLVMSGLLKTPVPTATFLKRNTRSVFS